MYEFAFTIAPACRRIGLALLLATSGCVWFSSNARAEVAATSPTVGFSDAPSCVSVTSMPYEPVTFVNDCGEAVTVTNAMSVFYEGEWLYLEDREFVLLPGKSAMIEAQFGQHLGWHMEDGSSGTITLVYEEYESEEGCDATGDSGTPPFAWIVLLGAVFGMRRRGR